MARDVSVTRGSGSSLQRLYESESEREGIEEIHSYHGDTTVKAKSWTCLLKLSLHC